MSFALLGPNAHRSIIRWLLGAVLLFFATAPAWGALATDVIVSTNRSTSGSNITSPSFSTTSAAELLLAFLATDAKSPGIAVTSMSGAGLQWALVRRTNVQLGTAEIWRAFAPAKLSGVSVRANLSQSVPASITIVTFTGADTSGTNGAGAIGATGSGNANPGAPSASLVTTRDNSWVFGVGNDYDTATTRATPSDQTMVNQYLAKVGDTYWVQRQNFPTAVSGTTVAINDISPATDRYNLTIVEVRAAPPSGATYTVSGTIAPAASGSGATVTLSGTAAATVTADGSGNYMFTGIAKGSYTVTPSKAGFTFAPVNQAVTISGASATGVNFTAQAATTFSISGAASPSSLSSGAIVNLTLNGSVIASITVDTNGNYGFTNVANGTYTVTPTKSGANFSPANQTIIVSGANVGSVNFTATPPPPSGGDWLMYGHDPQRSGNAAGESVITPTSARNLALKWSASLDGVVTAQPLFVSATQVGGQTRDVLVAATAANSVYAIDAGSGAQLWRKNFGPSGGSPVIPGGFGITGTPAIDRMRGVIYVVSDDGQLRTIKLADGTEATSAVPIVVDSITQPTLSNTSTNRVWGGLNLVGNNLYIVTASDGDDTNPWWGRILRMDVSGAGPVLAGWFKVVPSIPMPNGGGGIWGYGGVSVDTLGRVLAATSADSKPYSKTVPEGYSPYAGRMVALAADLGYSAGVNPLGNPLGSYEPPHPSPCPGAPGVCDMDFGATPIVFQPPSCSKPLTAAINKDGHIYVLLVDDLATSATASLQSLALNIAYDGPGAGGLTGVPAYWPDGNMLYVTDGGPGINGISAGVVGLTLNCNSPPNYLQVAWSVPLAAANEQPPSPPTVTDGVVFVGSGLNGSVHAYDATNGTELWNSGSTISGATFAAPIVASGTLYVASWNGFNPGDGGTVRAFAPGAAPPPPPPVLLGDQAVESVVDSNTSGSAEAFPANASAAGTVGKLSLYLDSTSTATTLIVGLYGDSGGGHPGALIAQGNSSQLQAGAWNSIAIPGAIVAAGTRYWIAILSPQNASGTLRFRDGPGAAGCTSETSAQTNLTALPLTWVTGTVWASCPLSAYGSTGP